MLRIFYSIGDLNSDEKRTKKGRDLLETALKIIDKENGKTDVRSIEILRHENGKPYLKTGEHFNISHTHNIVVCAVSDLPVGIDIEGKREQLFNVARKIISSKETAQLEQMSREERAELLLRQWVMSEALAKHSGEGINAILKAPLNPQRITDNLYKTNNIFLHIYKIENYAVCVASEYQERVLLRLIN